MAKAKAKKKATVVSVQEIVPADKATMVVTVYDGTRQPIQGGDFLIRVFDGFQNQLFDDDRPAPTTVFNFPCLHEVVFACIQERIGRNGLHALFDSVRLPLHNRVDLVLIEKRFLAHA